MKIYICPALMDALIFLVMFAVMYRAGDQGMSITQCAWMACLFQLAYMFTSLAVGFLLSRHNTRVILLARYRALHTLRRHMLNGQSISADIGCLRVPGNFYGLFL